MKLCKFFLHQYFLHNFFLNSSIVGLNSFDPFWVLSLIKKIIFFRSMWLKEIKFHLYYNLINKDFRLLFREVELFLAFSKKLKSKTHSDITNILSKTFTILRSPFVYSKSKEHYSYNQYNLKIYVQFVANILYFSYFIMMHNFFIKYSRLQLIKVLS